MATTFSFQIRVIKNQIQACLREIKRGVKAYIDTLVTLEGKLEELEMKDTAVRFELEGAIIHAYLGNDWVAKIVNKSHDHWLTNEYVSQYEVTGIGFDFLEDYKFASVDEAKVFILNSTPRFEAYLVKTKAFWSANTIKMENKKTRIVNASECGKR